MEKKKPRMLLDALNAKVNNEKKPKPNYTKPARLSQADSSEF